MLGLSDKGKLYFALLGPPQVYLGGRLLAFPSRKALAFLLYLAVDRGNMRAKRFRNCSGPRAMLPMLVRPSARRCLSYAMC